MDVGKHAPRVSVLVPVYNNEDVIDELLASLADQEFSHPWEVIFADNGSSDESLARIAAWADRLPALTCIDASDVRGPSHARNRAAEHARADLVAYIDADDVAARGWLAGMYSALLEHPFVTGPIELQQLNEPEAIAWVNVHEEWSHQPPTSLGWKTMAMGCNFGIHRSVLEELGGWNEHYLYGEDTDLSWRAQLADYDLTFEPEAKVHYRLRATMGSLARQQRFRGYVGHALADDFAQYGFEPPSEIGRAGRKLALLAVSAPLALFSKTRRGRWVADAAYGWGWVSGRSARRNRSEAPSLAT